MEGKCMEEIRETMSIIIEGSNEIDIETLSTTLTNTSRVLKKSTQYSLDGEYQKFVVKDVRKGSFVIDLAAVISANPDLLGNVVTAISMFKTFLDIKKHLQGNKPKGIIEIKNNFIVENNNGTILNVDKITFNAYTDTQEIEDNLSRLMKSLSNDERVTSLKVVTTRNEETNESTYNPDAMSSAYDVSLISNKIDVQRTRQVIKLAKLDFVGTSKWQAYVNTELVSLNMLDEEFRNNISEYSFTLGTKLDVELEIRYQVDNLGFPVRGKKAEYRILKVYSVSDSSEKNEQISIDNYN